MLDLNRKLVAPVPIFQVSGRALRVNRLRHCGHQYVVIGAVSLRQPSRRPVSDDVLKRRPRESPVVIYEIFAHSGSKQQLHQITPAPVGNCGRRTVLFHPAIPAAHDLRCLAHALRGILCMIHGIDKTVREEALEFGGDIGLDG